MHLPSWQIVVGRRRLSHVCIYLYVSCCRYLTAGAFNVYSIVGVNTLEAIIYFVSSKPSSIQRALYAVDLNGTVTRLGLTSGSAWYGRRGIHADSQG